MREKLDKYWIGVILGLILPALFIYVYILRFNLWYSIRTFGMEISETLCKMLLLSVFPNLAGMFICYAAEVWKVSKGLLIGSFPYLIACLLVTL